MLYIIYYIIYSVFHPQQFPLSTLIWNSNQRTTPGGIRITLRVATEGRFDGATSLKINTVS